MQVQKIYLLILLFVAFDMRGMDQPGPGLNVDNTDEAPTVAQEGVSSQAREERVNKLYNILEETLQFGKRHYIFRGFLVYGTLAGVVGTILYRHNNLFRDKINNLSLSFKKTCEQFYKRLTCCEQNIPSNLQALENKSAPN